MYIFFSPLMIRLLPLLILQLALAMSSATASARPPYDLPEGVRFLRTDMVAGGGLTLRGPSSLVRFAKAEMSSDARWLLPEDFLDCRIGTCS